jgi:hypothetical protein
MKFSKLLKRGSAKLVNVFLALLICCKIPAYAAIAPGNDPGSGLINVHTVPNDQPLGDFQSITIPLKRVGRLFLIEAKIDNEIGNLVFDTGASGLVLNRTYFRKYVTTEKSGGGGITGSVGQLYQIVVGRIDISNLYYQNVTADLTDLGHIENRRGMKILGLFGINMIDNFEIIFDASNNELQLNRIDKQGIPLNVSQKDMKFDFTQKLEKKNSILVLQGKVGDKTLNFCLDTGAESNVVSSNVSKKAMSTIQINRRSVMGGAGAQTIDVLYGTMNDFKFGNQQFGSMETIVTSLETLSESYGFTVDGMLGFDFWQKGVFRINFNKNEISFSLTKGENK